MRDAYIALVKAMSVHRGVEQLERTYTRVREALQDKHHLQEVRRWRARALHRLMHQAQESRIYGVLKAWSGHLLRDRQAIARELGFLECPCHGHRRSYSCTRGAILSYIPSYIYIYIYIYIYYYTPLPLNLANKPQQQQQARHHFVFANAPPHRLGLDSTLAILQPRWCPWQIQILSQKLTGGGPGRGRQVGRCPPESAQFWAKNSHFSPKTALVRVQNSQTKRNGCYTARAA